jgi:hypothetical protein
MDVASLADYFFITSFCVLFCTSLFCLAIVIVACL